MNFKNFTRRNLRIAVVAATALIVAGHVAYASPLSDEQSLRRGAVEDMTPQQKYQSAIREAGGAHKEALRECAALAGDDRRTCTGRARATYDLDMAEARLILRGRELNQTRAGG